MSRADPSSSGPSPPPPHIRPSASRHNSSSSTSSSLRHPHAQQREYVPSTLDAGAQPGPSGLGERWAFEHAEHPHPEADDSDDACSEADWIAAKEQDDARRPAWRRASPRWLYPFVSGATLALGMGIAPRSEIYVNLACLAHPPQVPSSLSLMEAGVGGGLKLYSFHSLYAESMVRTATSIGIGNSTVPQADISPADRWFLKAQRDIYDHEWSRHHTEMPHTSPADTGESPPTKPEQPPYREIDPKTCKRDPTVQAAATRLSMIMTLVLGCLAALTTGYWGQMSDKIGRTKIIAIMMTGLLFNDVSFILVATFPHLAPGGYRALLIGPICEGLLGGISTLTATVNAYVSDVTPDGSRAAVFARMGGIIMLGFAFGPVLGSAVIKATGNIMTPFYLNVVIQAFYITCILFILPESLSKEARTILRKKSMVAVDAQRRKDTLAREWEDETPAVVEQNDPFAAGESGWSRRFTTGATSSRRQKRMIGALRRAFRRGTAFLQPLGVFLPVAKEGGGRDWNMTVTGAALFTMSLMMGVYQVKTQYTLYSFGWTSAQLGPYMSLLGFSRGFVMLVLLPLAMRIAKPYFIPAPTAEPSSSSFSDATVRPTTESSPLLPTSPTPPVKARRPATLDLWTARLSLAWESVMYFLLVLNLPEIPFIAISALVTLAAGSNPAANSLALSFIPNSREAGKLFGGVAVLHALGSTLLGPLLFGSLFSATVGSFTSAVWVLAGLVQAISLGFMCFVRIPREKSEGELGEDERGRGRGRKGRNGAGGGGK